MDTSAHIKTEQCDPIDTSSMSLVSEEVTQNDAEWTEKFIRCIETKPALYNKKLKEHSDRKITSRTWNEVCESMVPTWNSLSTKDKTLKGKEIQHRWRNLRTCFRRELNKQKQEKSGQTATKHDRETVSESSPPQTDNDSENENEVKKVIIDSTPRNIPRKKKKNETRRKPSFEASLLAILKKKQEQHKEIDEDKTFLLSLVPSFKKLNEEQKFEAKMEFLAVLKRISTQQSSGVLEPDNNNIRQFSSVAPARNFNFNYHIVGEQSHILDESSYSNAEPTSP